MLQEIPSQADDPLDCPKETLTRDPSPLAQYIPSSALSEPFPPSSPQRLLAVSMATRCMLQQTAASDYHLFPCDAYRLSAFHTKDMGARGVLDSLAQASLYQESSSEGVPSFQQCLERSPSTRRDERKSAVPRTN